MANTRKFRLNHWLAAGLTFALLQAGVLNAAGLGRLNVLSQMGQPFVGEIELLNVSRDELSTLNARLAPTAAYQAANLRFDPALNSLRLSVEQRPNGTPYLRAASTRPVSEPYLDLLVELTSQNGKFQRQYSALLDPPGLVEPPGAAPAPSATAPAPKADAVAPPAAKAASRPAPASRPATTAAPTAAAPVAAAPAVVPAPPRVAAAPVPAPPAPSAAVTPAEAPSAPTPKVDLAKPKTETAAAEAPKAEAPPAEAPKPAAKESEAPPAAPSPPASVTTAEAQKTTAPPMAPAAPQRGIVDAMMDNLLPVGAGALALLAALGFWLVSRRKPTAGEPAPAIAAAPTIKTTPQARAASATATSTVAGATAVAATTTAPATAPIAPVEPTVANVTDMVDPIEEAQVYLDHGADQQAEDILRKALTHEPRRADLQAKLLEILAARGDKDGFNKIAGTLREQTGGMGEYWARAATLGAAVDPTNPLYPTAAQATAPATPQAADAGVDFDLGGAAATSDPLNSTTQILLQDDSASLDMEKTMVLPRAAAKAPAPPAEAPLDFNFELPQASAPAAEKPTPVPAAQPDNRDQALDFKINFPDVNLNLDDKSAVTINPAFEVKSAQWEEVQQKFDLVLAYKEMGDKEGMREALQEIEREGDAAQKALAQKMLQEIS